MPGKQPRQIARAIADDRHRLLGQRREDELALFAVRQRLARVRIDDFRKKMILPDRQPVFGRGIFLRDAGTDDFGQAVEIDRIEAHAALDLGAHGLGPRLGAEQRDAQRRFARVDALAIEFVGDGEQIRRRHRDDVGLEVANELHLPLGEAAADRDDGAAEIFGAVMKARARR